MKNYINHNELSLINSFFKFFNTILRNQFIIHKLVIRNIKSKYRQSFLGVLWIILMPLIPVLIFIILNNAGILNLSNKIENYTVFALTGVILYNLFSNIIRETSKSLVNSRDILVKINFSKIIIIISAVYIVIIEFLINFVFLLILMLIFNITFTYKIFLIPVFILPIIIFALSIGLIFSLISVIVRDTLFFIDSVLMILIFILPVLYPLPKKGILKILILINPLSYFIMINRNLLLNNNITNWIGFIISFLIVAVIFLYSIRFFYISEKKLNERL